MAAHAAAGDEGPVGKVKVKEAMLSKAIKALTQVIAKRSANANPLFDSGAETMNMIFTLSTIPDKRRIKPLVIPLPHPMFDDKSDVCFISKDPQKAYKELLLQKHPVPGLTKVIGIDKLRRNYKTLEAKRALADAFDLFLCDSRVLEMMPKMLGNVFYQKKHKPPIPVNLKFTDPKPRLEQAINGTTLRVPAGPCVGVKIGRCSMTEEQLVKNAMEVIAVVLKHFAKAGNPVQSIAVQATDAVALPVWRRKPPPGELLDLKKYHSDAASSAASDTGASGASETEATSNSEVPSDTGETLSTRDSLSEIDTAGETASEVDTTGETPSELDSEAGDTDAGEGVAKEELPLFIGLKKKNKRRRADSGAAAPIEVAADKAPAAASMAPPPPLKKAKKAAKGKAA
jgi:ribosome biogenesis protein UTP30